MQFPQQQTDNIQQKRTNKMTNTQHAATISKVRQRQTRCSNHKLYTQQQHTFRKQQQTITATATTNNSLAPTNNYVSDPDVRLPTVSLSPDF